MASKTESDLDPGADEDVPPRPSALIESLRSFGYSPETAIADLLDNSVTAGAKLIDIRFEWAGPDSKVIILDDGEGMDEVVLRAAMRPGSVNPLETRSPKDLGRFGLGLKTASFSQARSLTVASKRRLGDPLSVRRWDLDHVGRTDRWSLLKTARDDAADAISSLDPLESGTLVIWDTLDRIVDARSSEDTRARNAFFAMVDQVKAHLEMVFHRIISEDGLEISINSRACVAWDPFLSRHPKTEIQPNEDREVSLPNGHREKLKIQPFILPHSSELSKEEHALAAGPKGWNLQQGFYLYRARRLIVAGGWFDPGIKPEEHHKLARIRVEITQDMDSDWNLDVRKARARPPAALREDFARIARATRSKAEEVYRHRGKRSVGQGSRRQVVSLWNVESAAGKFRYRVNRDHPSVANLFEAVPPEARLVLDSTLKLIETNIPIGHIVGEGFRDEEKLASQIDSDVGRVAQAARTAFRYLRTSGADTLEARAILHTTQPFDNYPAVVEALEDEDTT